MNRIMIAGTHSGCGKTTVTCGLLKVLKETGYKVSAFKCGPDYIDPMFHSKIIKVKSRNLDGFFTDKNTMNYLLYVNSHDSDISVIEGVMGFYDGYGGKASAYDVSNDTGTPVIIVIDCSGMSGSVGAVINGYLNYKKPNNVVGFIFNRMPISLEDDIKKLCSQMGTEYFGYIPKNNDFHIGSRHLGLITADEIKNLNEKLKMLSDQINKTVLIDKIIEIAGKAEIVNYEIPKIPKLNDGKNARIAVAYDRAFCFYYEDNLDLLRKMGGEIIFFSPLEDSKLPDNIDGLILGGGYPELYADKLSENKEMLESVRSAANSKIPIIAECGGYMYLHKSVKFQNGKEYRMAGVIDGITFETSKLQRFGYAELTADRDNLLCKKGEIVRSHEFHYWDSSFCGDCFTARKLNGKQWKCGYSTENIIAGFPHFYFYNKPSMAESFLKKCLDYRSKYGKTV